MKTFAEELKERTDAVLEKRRQHGAEQIKRMWPRVWDRLRPLLEEQVNAGKYCLEIPTKTIHEWCEEVLDLVSLESSLTHIGFRVCTYNKVKQQNEEILVIEWFQANEMPIDGRKAP